MREHPVILHLHIPKTGGTTLNKYIYKHWAMDTNDVAENDYLHSGVYYFPTGFFHENTFSITQGIRRVVSRNDVRAIVGHFGFGIHRYVTRPWAYVTLLRNPLNRIVSLYYHLSPTGVPDIEAFTSNPAYNILDNDQTRRLAGLDPKSDHCTRKTLQRAKENLRRHFSIVGLTERFDETLILMYRKFGWSKKLAYYLKNVNTRRPSLTTLTPNVIDKIKARNEFDFELYEHATEIFNETVSAQDASFAEALERFATIKNAHTPARTPNNFSKSL